MTAIKNLGSGIAKRLEEIQRDKDQTLTHFLEENNIQRQAFYGYRSDKNTPSLQKMAQVAVDLGISLDWLVLGRGQKESSTFTPAERMLIGQMITDAHKELERRLGEKGFDDITEEGRSEAIALLVNEAMIDRKFLTENNPNVSDLLNRVMSKSA